VGHQRQLGVVAAFALLPLEVACSTGQVVLLVQAGVSQLDAWVSEVDRFLIEEALGADEMWPRLG